MAIVLALFVVAIVLLVLVARAVGAPAGSGRTARGWWLAFALAWVATAVVPVIPQWQDDSAWLTNLTPVVVGYAAVLFDLPHIPGFVLAILAAHLVLCVLLAFAALRAWRALGPRRFRWAAAVAAGLYLSAGVWALNRCWPDGLYFDAHNTYYDLSEFLAEAPGTLQRFGSTEEVAAKLRERMAGKGEHYGPHLLLALEDNRMVAWGTWPEHYRLRRELEALRGE